MSDNTKNNSRIAKNTAFLYIRMLFALVVSLYTSRVVLNTLGVEDFGIYNVVAGFVSMFAFLNSSLIACIQRFYNYENGKNGSEGFNKVYNISLIVQLVLAVIVLILVESFGVWYLNNKLVIPIDRLPAAHVLFQCSVLSLVLVILNIPYSAAVVAKERMDFYAFVGVFEVVAKLLFVLALPYVPLDKLITYSFLQVLLSLMSFGCYFIYSKRKFVEIHFNWEFDKKTFKDMMSFSGWNVLGASAMVARNQGLNVILNLFCGPVVNAARGVAYQVSSALMSFMQSITSAARPQIVESYAKGQTTRSFSLMYTISKLCFVMLFLMAYPISLRIDYILHLWLGNSVPEHTGIFSILVLAAALIDSLNTPVTMLTMAKGKIGLYCFVSSILGLLVLPLSYYGMKLTDNPNSVFISGIIISLSVQVACVIIMCRLFGESVWHYLKRIVLPLFAVLVVSIPIPYVINPYINDSFGGLLVIIGITTIIICFSTFLLGCTRSERELVISLFKKIFHKKEVA